MRRLSDPIAITLGSGPWSGLAWPRALPHSIRDADARERHEARLLAAELAAAGDKSTRAAKAARAVVLVPAGAVEPDSEHVPARARELLAAAPAGDLRYALAELDGELIHSVSLRVRRNGSRGWAVWRNGSYDSGQWWECGRGWPRNVLVRELTALVEGTDYVPPSPRAPTPKGPCPRCGAAVRWTFAGGVARTYAHNRSHMVDNVGVKERCE